MFFDLVAWYESVACTGLDYKAVAPNETFYANAGDDLYTKWDGYIPLAMCQTAAIANLIEWRLGIEDEAIGKWPRSDFFKKDQTGIPGSVPMYLNYPFAKGDTLNAQASNGGNAQVEAIAALLCPKGKNFDITTEEPRALHKLGCKWITGIADDAATGGQWSPTGITWDYPFNRDRSYDVYGIQNSSLTGYYFRLVPLTGPKHRPGWMSGDTTICAQPLYSTSPMLSFDGLNPPNGEILASGNDAAATNYWNMYIIER